MERCVDGLVNALCKESILQQRFSQVDATRSDKAIDMHCLQNNIFGWATAALMSGFKGVWSSRKSLGTSSPLARPQLSTGKGAPNSSCCPSCLPCKQFRLNDHKKAWDPVLLGTLQ